MDDGAAEQAEAIKALQGPGAKRVKLRADLRRLDAELKPLITRAIKADVPIRKIAEMTGLSTNTVMLWSK